MSEKIGYARVSTEEQNLEMQIEALKKEGCNKIFKEKITGRKEDRTEFGKCMDYLRNGDTLVIYKLDRLGRTTKQLVNLAASLREKGIELASVQDGIDTSTAQGRFFFHIMSAFAEMEVELTRERTRAGLAAARARGRKGGRPRMSQEKLEKAIKLYNAKTHTLKEITEITGVSKSKLYQYLKQKR
ncbi:recombinase family protein [Pontibacillus litoralis]|uniref:Transposon resolvase n=1 Tax=Pontibacillus litoralis JSM 072002 TaxID=1385512 RepID=A0A0A5FZJ9_9BACI|nr:recombinase family protein [Pontibacillus litoralis]KGX85219.1 transposon resolvase [Pontibacillus litoralis JSM 072002]